MTRSVYAIIESNAQLREVAHSLEKMGFRQGDISVIFPDDQVARSQVSARSRKEDAIIGSLSGAGIGRIVGFMTRIGAVAVPGTGAFIVAGPILDGIRKARVDSGSSSLADNLFVLGVTMGDATRYEAHLNAGRVLISVSAGSSEWVERARSVLTGQEAIDITVSSSGGTGEPQPRPSHTNETQKFTFEVMAIDIDEVDVDGGDVSANFSHL